MIPWILLTLIATLVLVVAEANDRTLWKTISKPVASIGFVLAAHAAGALSTPYGRVMIVALAFCLVGDLLLLPESKRAFVAGLGSFLVGHLAFAFAFRERGIDGRWALTALLAIVPLAILVLRWLHPHTHGAMRIAVAAYILAIVAMFSTAAGTTGAHGDWRIFAGALLFLVSDLAVARNRFVRRAAINRIAGLPLYYAAQLLLASSVAARG